VPSAYHIQANGSSLGNGGCNGHNGGGSILGIKDGLNNSDLLNGTINSNHDYNNDDNESESLQYINPGNDDLNIVYSVGTQKTDLLY